MFRNLKDAVQSVCKMRYSPRRLVNFNQYETKFGCKVTFQSILG
jgi:hypothetical protein